MKTTDVRIPGDLRIRLIDVPRAAIRGLDHDVGPLGRYGGPAEQPVDVTIRFVQRLPSSGVARSLNRGYAGHDDQSFWLAADGGGRVAIELDRLGNPLEILAEHPTRHIPLIRDVVALRLLATGRVLLHAAAVRMDGQVVLVTGWQKGGKTELLLGSMAAGAEFISDEWTVVDPGRAEIAGVGSRLHVWDWQLAQLPELSARLAPTMRARLRVLGWWSRAFAVLGRPSLPWPADILGRAARPGGLASIAQVHPSPERLFAAPRLARARLDAVILAAVGGDGIDVTPIAGEEVAARIVGSLAFERRALLDAHAAFRYAFPDRRNELLEAATERERALLVKAFDGARAFEVVHPYPVDLRALARAVREALGPTGR
jgi:hypothetical protein